MAILIRVILVYTILVIYLFAIKPVHADDALQLHEQEIEAGLIYNFLKYIEWPATDTQRGGVITICLYGDDPFKGYLQPMEGRSVNQRRINLSIINNSVAVASCDLLFINAAEKDQWPQLEKSLSGKTVLTVSNLDDFVRSGGMIEFGHSDNHIRVLLNLDAMTAAKLKVQDRLLKLVTVVQNSSGKGQ